MAELAVVVLGVVIVAVVTALSRRVNIAGPLVLVAIGLLLAVLPFVPDIQPVDPEWILVGVLPPLLYSAAVRLPAIEFRRDFRPVAGLSVLLVVASAVLLGFFFAWVIPGLSLPVGIALGAILSPTDAVATSIVKRMGIAPRVVTMLEGESLLNDATALVLLRTAIVAIAGGFSFGTTVLTFFWGVLVALIIGALIGYLSLRLRVWVADSAANTALSFAIPFAAYLPTEQLGGSGLVAAVAAGIVTGQGGARWLPPEQRLSDAANWRTIELVLEGGVFLVMGLELSEVMTRNILDHGGLWPGTWLALSALLIILLTRAVYVTLLVWRQGHRARRFERIDLDRFGMHLDDVASGGPAADGPGGRDRRRRRARSLRRRLPRLVADLDYYRSSPLGWKHGTVIVWAGMRGVVTLAAAQTLPADTERRPLLIFVAFLVAIISLLLQGFTLPLLVRVLRIPETAAGPTPEEQHRLDLELREAAGAALGGDLRRRDGSPFSERIVDAVGSRLVEPPDDDTSRAAAEALELRLVLIQAMRRHLVEVGASGRFSTAALRHALAELDADELSLELRLDGEGDD
ncbi:sodium:proton antiporter [Microbacterium caowuchunii]|uniref:cation:proton antiporter n=1 Tax=Microbacterium caowuchunii TaxID=2614638 RepID=UPI0012494654|nr:sodium:proton antiporter [Microbacterium caowuchunii]QEV98826.1 sodium:proton antiporter [Microbacterium caowuchunii]